MIRLDRKLFVRTPENDFNDDGSKFRTYRFGKYVEVTFSRLDNIVFITAGVSDERVKNWDCDHRYNVWRLKSKDCQKYNGVFESAFKAEDFTRICSDLEELLNHSDKELCDLIDGKITEERQQARKMHDQDQQSNVTDFFEQADQYGIECMIAELKNRNLI